jgi:hypothetical protein
MRSALSGPRQHIRPASVITFDIITPDELAVTVECGRSLQGGYFTEGTIPA